MVISNLPSAHRSHFYTTDIHFTLLASTRHNLYPLHLMCPFTAAQSGWRLTKSRPPALPFSVIASARHLVTPALVVYGAALSSLARSPPPVCYASLLPDSSTYFYSSPQLSSLVGHYFAVLSTLINLLPLGASRLIGSHIGSPLYGASLLLNCNAVMYYLVHDSLSGPYAQDLPPHS